MQIAHGGPGPIVNERSRSAGRRRAVLAATIGNVLEWYDFLKYDLKPDKVNINYIRPPSADPNELNFDHKRYGQLSQMILKQALRPPDHP